jgi:hypothetical protein
MKKIANSLMPLAALILFGTCLVTVFGLVVVLMTSVGLAEGVSLSYYQRLNIPIISVGLPIVGMILFAAILLGLPGKPAEVVESIATDGDIHAPTNEEEKEKERRLEAAA